MGAHPGPGTRNDDRAASLGAIAAYAFGLGIATVVIPLLALDTGYDPAAVGFLVAIAAGSQFATRLFLPALLGRFPDRALIGLGCVGMVVTFCLLIASSALPVFIAAQVLQGASRALVWTSSQTHAVRGAARPVQRLVDLNVAGNVGSLTGPAVGGMLAVAGLPVALAVAASAAAVAAIASRGMRSLPPYDRRRGAGTVQLLGRDGVDVACWASAVGGGWWSMMGSYVPVLAVATGIGSVGVGWLITLAEGAGIVALVLLRRIRPVHVRAVVRGAAVIVVLALVGLALVASSGTSAMVEQFALLVITGCASSGTITTLAPAMASLAARPEEQGDVMALTGMFRAGALLAAPAVVALTLTLAGIPAAVAIVAGGLGLPGLVVGRGRGAPPTVADEAGGS
jgi:MFS family permease